MDNFAPTLAWLLLAAVHVAVVLAALLIIPKRRKPTAAMAWLLLIVLLPYVGVILFLLIGSFRLPRKRREEQARVDALIAERVAGLSEPDQALTWPLWFQKVVDQ